MGIMKRLLDGATGNSRPLTPAEKEQREQATIAKRQREALERASASQAAGSAPKAPAAKPAAPRPTTAAGAAADASTAETSNEAVVPYTGAITVTLPTGRVANHGWQALRPAELSPLYATLDAATIERIMSEVSGEVLEDPSARLLTHISPSHAREELAYYVLGDRYYTTLPVKRFGTGPFDPKTWRSLLGRKSTLSIHFWRTTIAVAEKGLRDEIAKKELKLEELRSESNTQVQQSDAEREIAILRAQLARIVSREETLYRVSAYLRVGADTLPELREMVKKLQAVGHSKNMNFDAPLARQRDAYLSSMPFSSDPADFTHSMVATQATQLFPFLSRAHQETDSDGRGTGVLYGIHQYNRTPVMINPWNRDKTVQITTVLGRPGSGKSYWLRCHLGRLAMTGVQIIAIDPINDFGLWFKRNGGQEIVIAPGSPWHVNPLKLIQESSKNSKGETIKTWENIDVKIDQRLKPLFRLLLGDSYTGMADGLIGHGLRVFYDRFGTEEHLLSDLVDLLRELNQANAEGLASATIEERRKLIDSLNLKLLNGEFRDYFAHKTNIELNNRKIVFNLKPTAGGMQRAFATYLAVTMAVNLAAQSMDRKVILVDEIHRLFQAQETAGGIGATLEDLLRTHRHWNTAVTFATQFVRDDKVNVAQEALLTSTNTWILMRATEPMLARAAKQVSENANLDLIMTLKVPEAEDQGVDKSPRPGIIYREGTPIPFLSVGLGFEDEEDDKESSLRRDDE